LAKSLAARKIAKAAMMQETSRTRRTAEFGGGCMLPIIDAEAGPFLAGVGVVF
jgi:hypothetical protein